MQGLSTSLVLIALLAVVAPLAARFLDRAVKVPIVVFEIVLGIVLGPSLLGWIQPTEFVDTLAQFGLAMLFFVAGNEVDFAAIRDLLHQMPVSDIPASQPGIGVNQVNDTSRTRGRTT